MRDFSPDIDRPILPPPTPVRDLYGAQVGTIQPSGTITDRVGSPTLMTGPVGGNGPVMSGGTVVGHIDCLGVMRDPMGNPMSP